MSEQQVFPSAVAVGPVLPDSSLGYPVTWPCWLFCLLYKRVHITPVLRNNTLLDLHMQGSWWLQAMTSHYLLNTVYISSHLFLTIPFNAGTVTFLPLSWRNRLRAETSVARTTATEPSFLRELSVFIGLTSLHPFRTGLPWLMCLGFLPVSTTEPFLSGHEFPFQCLSLNCGVPQSAAHLPLCAPCSICDWFHPVIQSYYFNYGQGGWCVPHAFSCSANSTELPTN